MAKQQGTVQIQGTIGNLTFFKSLDGFMVKAKSQVSKEKLLSDPKFARTRENMAEFGNAGKSGKILRLPFTNLLRSSADVRMVSRLTSQCFKVLNTDITSRRGQRLVAKGDLTLFNNFEFNNKGILSATLLAPFTTAYDRVSGNVKITISSFIPQAELVAPQGTTHYQLSFAAAPVDFNTSKNTSFQTASLAFPWDNNATDILTLSLSLPPDSVNPVFLLMQVQFFEQLNGDNYSLQNGAYNACAIISVYTV